MSLMGSDPNVLLQHAAWVRGLARRLAGDAHEAEDLAQDTWLAFLRAPFDEVRAPRSFLGGILRHRWREARRAHARRSEREARVGREEGSPTPSAVEALEKAELARALVEIVLELDEPFRSAILLRYGEELTPCAIAERLGVAPRTVESRLRRGLARLRERWRTRFGAEAGRAFALLAPAPTLPAVSGATGGGALSMAIGALLVNTKLVLGVLVLAVGGGVWWLWSARAAPPAAPELAPAADASPPAELVRPRGELAPPPGAPDAQRTPAAETPNVAGTTPRPSSAPEPLRTLHGRVLDPEARPLSGIELAFADEKGRTWTAESASGAFELAVPDVSGEVRAADPALETLVAARVPARGTMELLVVVAPHRSLGGAVVDDARGPLPGARVRFQLPPGFMGRFATLLDTAAAREWTSVADENGRFRLERAPLVDGAELIATLAGYAPCTLEAPAFETQAIELVLARPELSGTTLSGRVVDRTNRPIAGAWVSLGAKTAPTDLAGEFRLDRGDPAELRELVAVYPGFRPARFEAELDGAGKPLFPDWIELVLDAPALSLAGRVVDEEGRGRAGLFVWIADPTRFGKLTDGTQAEIEFMLARGATTPGQFDQADWSAALTDAEGHFVLPGLLERDYALVVYDPERLDKLAAGSFAAGRDDVRIVFARGDLAPLAGRVMSRRGVPLAGVLVFLSGETYAGAWRQGGAARTGEDGRFRFEHVGNARLSLILSGDDVVRKWDFLRERPQGELGEVLALRCNAKIELADPTRAGAFRILGESDEPLDLFEIDAGGVTYRREFALVDGRSVTFGVSEEARTLVLMKSGSEVERLPLRLDPAGLNEIRR